jgi:TRAP-type C4-dicarboxylate transport system substrate-binding protein
MLAGAKKANDDAIALIEKSGGKIIRPDKAAFGKAVEPVHKYFSTLVGQDLLDEIAAAQK